MFFCKQKKEEERKKHDEIIYPNRHITIIMLILLDSAQT